MTIGIAALLTGKTSEIITIAVFGALTLYIVSMVSVLRLRKQEPLLPRPFRVPLYPWFPVTALVIASVSIAAMMADNFRLGMIYTGLMVICFAAFRLFHKSPGSPSSH
jgi:ethanolamine permease